MRWVFILLWLPIILAAGLFFAATDVAPSLEGTDGLKVEDLDRGKAVFKALGLNRLREGETRQLVLDGHDLDRGVNYLFARAVGGRASTRIALGQMLVRASLPLPRVNRYLNVEVALVTVGDMLEPTALALGRVPLPPALTTRLAMWAIASSPYAEDFASARQMLESAQVRDGALALRFTWRRAAVEKIAKKRIAPGLEDMVVDPYRIRLAQAPARDFAQLIGMAFALAQTRSGASDPVAENRAALTALAERALGGRLVSNQGLASLDRKSGYKLGGREDFAQHFALSAFLAATGGGEFSDVAGLYKEMKDASDAGGSGFSFTDLAADRAGSRLGEEGTRSAASARRIQGLLAGSQDARAFFPPVSDLPEFMHQAEFLNRFGGVGEPAYQKMVEEIERRIAGLAVFGAAGE